MGIAYYADTQRIIEALASEGLLTEAQALTNVMGAGSTATEILMGIRWQLQQIEAANRTANTETKKRIRDLIMALSHELS